MARRSQSGPTIDDSKFEMSSDERFVFTNRIRLVKLRLFEAEGAIKKDHKSFDEKIAEYEDTIKVLNKQRDSASRKRLQAAKECQAAVAKAERVDKRAKEVISQATACRALIIDN